MASTFPSIGNQNPLARDQGMPFTSIKRQYLCLSLLISTKWGSRPAGRAAWGHPTGVKQNSIVVGVTEIVSHLKIKHTHMHAPIQCAALIYACLYVTFEIRGTTCHYGAHNCGANSLLLHHSLGDERTYIFTACWPRDSGQKHTY